MEEEKTDDLLREFSAKMSRLMIDVYVQVMEVWLERILTTSRTDVTRPNSVDETTCPVKVEVH